MKTTKTLKGPHTIDFLTAAPVSTDSTTVVPPPDGIKTVRIVETETEVLNPQVTIEHRELHRDTHRHRTNGPSHIGIYPNDETDHLITAWFTRGQRQRLDGPALTKSEGDLGWTVNNTTVVRTSG